MKTLLFQYLEDRAFLDESLTQLPSITYSHAENLNVLANTSVPAVVFGAISTGTGIKSARDKDSIQNGIQDSQNYSNGYKIYLATQTLTEVKNDTTDRDPIGSLRAYLSTQTFTRVVEESSDQDR